MTLSYMYTRLKKAAVKNFWAHISHYCTWTSLCLGASRGMLPRRNMTTFAKGNTRERVEYTRTLLLFFSDCSLFLCFRYVLFG